MGMWANWAEPDQATYLCLFTVLCLEILGAPSLISVFYLTVEFEISNRPIYSVKALDFQGHFIVIFNIPQMRVDRLDEPDSFIFSAHQFWDTSLVREIDRYLGSCWL